MIKTLLLSLLMFNIFFSSIASEITNINPKEPIFENENSLKGVYQYIYKKYDISFSNLEQSQRRAEFKMKQLTFNKLNLNIISFIFRAYDDTYKNPSMAMDKTMEGLRRLTPQTVNLNLISYIYTKYKKSLSSALAMNRTLNQLENIAYVRPDLPIISYLYEAYFSTYNNSKYSMDTAIRKFKILPSIFTLEELEAEYLESLSFFHTEAEAIDFIINEHKEFICFSCCPDFHM